MGVMRIAHGYAALFVLCVLGASACPSPTPPPRPVIDQVCAEGVRVCDNDRLCVGGFCDKESDGDDIPFEADALGCCSPPLCERVDLCTSDRECCEGERCNRSRGICEDATRCDPFAEGPCPDELLCYQREGTLICSEGDIVSSCVIDAGAATTTSSRPLHISALPFASISGERVIAITPRPTFTTSSGTIDENGVLSAECATGICVVTVTATYNDASCTRDVRVLAPVVEGDTRVAVVDAVSGDALDDVTVVSDGETLRTDENGIAIFSGVRASVSAFPDTHAWHTVLEPTNDILIATTRTLPSSDVAGIKGTVNFDELHTVGDVKLGLVGASSPTALPDLSLKAFFGEPVLTPFFIEGVSEPDTQQLLPSTAVVELGAEPIKGDFRAFSKPGESIPWAFGVEVRLAEIGELLSTTGTFPIFPMMPFFATADHDVNAAIELDAVPRPLDESDAQAWPFEEIEVEPRARLEFETRVRVDEAVPVDGIIIIAGAVVPRHGFVPLGIGGARRNEDGNFVDGTDEPTNVIAADYAPAHSGLNAGRLVVVIAAVDATELGSYSASSLRTRTFVFPSAIDAEIDAGPFLAPPAGTFVVGETAGVDDVLGATMYRIVLDDGAGAEWNVWSATPFTFDVLAHNPDGAPRAINARVEAFALDVSYDDVVSSKLDRLTLEPGAWAAKKF
jgi:hypothetical protein